MIGSDISALTSLGTGTSDIASQLEGAENIEAPEDYERNTLARVEEISGQSEIGSYIFVDPRVMDRNKLTAASVFERPSGATVGNSRINISGNLSSIYTEEFGTEYLINGYSVSLDSIFRLNGYRGVEFRHTSVAEDNANSPVSASPYAFSRLYGVEVHTTSGRRTTWHLVGIDTFGNSDAVFPTSGSAVFSGIAMLAYRNDGSRSSDLASTGPTVVGLDFRNGRARVDSTFSDALAIADDEILTNPPITRVITEDATLDRTGFSGGIVRAFRDGTELSVSNAETLGRLFGIARIDSRGAHPAEVGGVTGFEVDDGEAYLIFQAQ